MSRSLRGALFGAAASLLALSCASSDDTADVASERVRAAATTPRANVAQGAQPPSIGSTSAATPMALGLSAVTRDADGAPRTMRAVAPLAAPRNAAPADAARHHLARLAPALLASAPAADARVVGVTPLTGGASIVRVQQRVDGVEVYGGELRMLLDREGALSAVAGTLRARGDARAFASSAEDAAATALGAEFKIGLQPATLSLRSTSGDYRSFTAPPRTDVQVERLRTKPVYLPVDGRLVPAWFVEFFASQGTDGEVHAMRYLVSASGGKVLRRVNLTASEAHQYRVFADATGDKRPFDGPIEDFTPHPDGVPNRTYPKYVEPQLITIDGFNKHADPWLPPGATVVGGNNVTVFTDRNGDDKPDEPDLRPTTTGPRTFDYKYDPELDPKGDQQTKAGLVQLFYILNWLHDYWYDSGFTEVAGNAQVTNYGRGGKENDPIIAHGQDGADSYPGTDPTASAPRRNNANMSTPADGESPRMQMFLWTNSEAKATIGTGPDVDAGDFEFGAKEFDITADVVLVEDGSTQATTPPGSTTDACQAVTNSLAGKIALMDRGGCNFTDKVANAQKAGAIAVLVANNVPNGLIRGAGTAPNVTIGAVSITQDDGRTLKASMMNGTVRARVRRIIGTELDGDLDTAVISHEWGHYLHHRLAQCESTQQCGALSEGWADFVAMHLMVRAGDNIDGTYGVGIFDTHRNSEDAAFFAIRRYPYSVDKSKNPLTFKHIGGSKDLPAEVPSSGGGGDNFEVHNAGEVWATMMWEAYHALLKARPYDEARRRMSNYVVAGLQMTPPEATFTESRDAILQVANKMDVADMRLIAEAFARRGAGSCAKSPPPSSKELDEVEESFDLKANLQPGVIQFSDDVSSCDGDGHLDPGESGVIRFTLANDGAISTSNVTIGATTAARGVTVTAASIAEMGPFSSQAVELRVTATDDADIDGVLDLKLNLTGTTSCGDLAQVIPARIGVDEQPRSSATDDVEAFATPWTRLGVEAETTWHPIVVEGNRMWHGEDAIIASDTQLVSPSLRVGDGRFVIKFQHRHGFESGPVEANGADSYFDGGVVEVSRDDGKTWVDVTELGGKPGYGNTALLERAPGQGYVSENVLAGRSAYVGDSADFPAMQAVTIDLGKKLQGRSVKIRFRAGTDQATGGYGWDIDDIAVSGLENRPFTAVVPEHGVCQGGVGVDAGGDLDVAAGDKVALEGASTLPDVTWTQVSGPKVTLAGADQETATFTAPDVDDETTLVFRLTGTDGARTLMDEATVVIGVDDGCGCASGRPSSASLLVPLAAVGFALRRRRR